MRESIPLTDKKIEYKLDLLHKIRYALIRLLAGDAAIVLNAHIKIVEAAPGETVRLINCHRGIMLEGCWLPNRDGFILEFSESRCEKR